MKKDYSVFSAIFTILISAVVGATVLLFFSPGENYLEQTDLFSGRSQFAKTPVPAPSSSSPARVGLVAGHWGFDTGFVCSPELNNVREVDLNLKIAIMTRDYLSKKGVNAEIFQEFDSKLSDYTALALVSIHNDTCSQTNANASGFKVASAARAIYPAEVKKLNDCMIDRYARYTGMNYLGSRIKSDSDMFYAFEMLNDYTTVSIIETGSMGWDYRMLSERPDLMAQGIAEGIICYVNNETAKPDLEIKTKMIQTAIPEAQIHYYYPMVDELTQ